MAKKKTAAAVPAPEKKGEPLMVNGVLVYPGEPGHTGK